MSLWVLVAFCLASSGAYILEEDLPQEQLQLFLEEVLEEAQAELAGLSKLEDVNIDIDDVYLTIPFRFAFITTSTTLVGPTDIVVSNVTGQQLPSRSATVLAKLDLGDLKVSYSNLLLNVFGLQYSGPVDISLSSPEVTLYIHIYRNALSSCQTDASVSKPSGHVYVRLGEAGSVLWILSYALENFIRFVVLPQYLTNWSFFPDISVRLEQAIANAAHKLACK